ncbi:hypothetical protein F0562_025503 [Nyssa sinensis]|uniref:Uncharacterized protein n=1 Tax=Nyssa sinensis TaxID=561372 RepID=A0A5J5BC52_9ASTE|nr:hypothetical protein F0562_025503 [Nyssa sinensis]
MATREGSSLERTMIEGNNHCHEVPLYRPHLLNSPPAGDSDVVGTSTPLSRRRGKEVMTLGQGGGVSTQALEEDDSPLPSINDALRMAWELSWDKISGKLAQVSVSQAVHGLAHYEAHNLEAQLQL